MQHKSILAIDWGKKRIGMAYKKPHSSIVFPEGSLDNDADLLMNLSIVLSKHSIDHVIVGRPMQYSPQQEAIDVFVKKLSIICPADCKIETVSEEYSSVQANAHEGVYKKTAAEDSLAAAYILEERIKIN